MNSLGERSQMIYYDGKNNIKTIKTRIGDGLYSKLVTYSDGKRELSIYNSDELIYSTTV
jgi:hypothetical protein